MMRILKILLLMSLVGTAHGQGVMPKQIELSAIAPEYLLQMRDFDPSQDMVSGEAREIDSPYYTSKIIVQEESESSEVVAGKGMVRASVVMNGTPFVTFLIRQPQRFTIFWMDDEVFQITNWPEPCLELFTVYSVLERRMVYQAGFQHCGD